MIRYIKSLHGYILGKHNTSHIMKKKCYLELILWEPGMSSVICIQVCIFPSLFVKGRKRVRGKRGKHKVIGQVVERGTVSSPRPSSCLPSPPHIFQICCLNIWFCKRRKQLLYYNHILSWFIHRCMKTQGNVQNSHPLQHRACKLIGSHTHMCTTNSLSS